MVAQQVKASAANRRVERLEHELRTTKDEL